MRLKIRFITFSLITFNLILVYFTWNLLHINIFYTKNSISPITEKPKQIIIKDRIQTTNKHIKKSVTIIFCDFYHFDNDLKPSIDSILKFIPNIQIFIISTDELPYPPLDFLTNYTTINGITTNKNNIKFINLNFDVRKTWKSSLPLLQIKTKYILFIPDSFRLSGRTIIQKLIRDITLDSKHSSLTTADKRNDDNSNNNNNININNNNDENGGDDLINGKKSIQYLDIPPAHNNENKKMITNNNNNPNDDDPNSQLEIINKKINYKNKIDKKMLIIPFSSNGKLMSNCCKIKLDFANWSMEYIVKNGTDNCDLFLQKSAILVETSYVKDMPDALAIPFPEMFYIQAKLAKIKKIHSNTTFQDGKRLFTAFHNKQRKKEIRKIQFKNMYHKLHIKKVVRKLIGKPKGSNNNNNQNNHNNKNIDKSNKRPSENGKSLLLHTSNGQQQQHQQHLTGENINNNNNGHIQLFNNTLPIITTIEYYGCEKNTRSCIGNVYNMKPFYVYLKKHTPPCCLEKLKFVFHHVLDEFENVGIRYWLDNRALRNAIDINDLSMDAYEIDISFNLNDLERSVFLKKSQIRPLSDAMGFYWIKATDGHYFRVQYSKQNQIGINLLPFEIDGDRRVIPSGFYGWKAKEFSTEFLHPMSTVYFLGKNVMCPNNVREYLEFKNRN